MAEFMSTLTEGSTLWLSSIVILVLVSSLERQYKYNIEFLMVMVVNSENLSRTRWSVTKATDKDFTTSFPSGNGRHV